MNTDLFKGYRTFIVNIATLFILLATGLTGQIENPETLRYIAIGVTVANVLLRYFTSTAPGKSV